MFFSLFNASKFFFYFNLIRFSTIFFVGRNSHQFFVFHQSIQWVNQIEKKERRSLFISQSPLIWSHHYIVRWWKIWFFFICFLFISFIVVLLLLLLCRSISNLVVIVIVIIINVNRHFVCMSDGQWRKNFWISSEITVVCVHVSMNKNESRRRRLDL